MRFFDQARITVTSGSGGDGCCAFLRTRGNARGGPHGGNGGRGGHIYAQAAPDLHTLADFRYRRHYKARRGRHGSGGRRAGATGEDLILRVPGGCDVYDDDHDVLIASLPEVGARRLLLPGGVGGWGNAHFVTSVHRAPTESTPGAPGQVCWLRLELRLLADIGLVGLPNAGKSSLLAALTAARPKTAAYPFTSCVPSLGTLIPDLQELMTTATDSLVIADLPGLIAGAADGVGLGHRFLRHIERSRLLLHLIDISAPDPRVDYETIRRELAAYDPRLADKPYVLALNKSDLAQPAEQEDKRAALAAAAQRPVFLLSALHRQGIDTLRAELWQAQGQAQAQTQAPAQAQAVKDPAQQVSPRPAQSFDR